MAISTLNNISVPTAGGDNSKLLMPKLQYRFRVTLTSFGLPSSTEEDRILTRQVVDVTRPNVSFEQITLDAYNSRAYLAGKHTWEPITLNVRDDAGNNVQRIVGQQLQKQFDFFNQSSAVSADDYKFEAKIEILDGGNGGYAATSIDKFELYGCYIESANYNTLSYSTNDPATIALTIRYDNAIQFGTNGAVGEGIGSVVQRPGFDSTGTSTGSSGPAASADFGP